MSNLWNGTTNTAIAGEKQKQNACLAALSGEALALLRSHLQDTMLYTGAILWEPGKPSGTIYFPVDALISIVVPMRGGEVVEACSVGNKAAAGISFDLSDGYLATRGIVQIGGRVSQIAAAPFRAAADKNREIRTLWTLCCEWLLMQAQRNAACNAVHAADKRLCRWLYQACERLDTDTLYATQEAIGSILGVRRTTVTLMAQGLSQRGVIDYKRGKIVVSDPARLKAAACECCETFGRRHWPSTRLQALAGLS
jgi:CRP-like cAMP-binding protein